MTPSQAPLFLQVANIPTHGAQSLHAPSPSSSHSSYSELHVDVPRRESDDWTRRQSGSSTSSWASADVRENAPVCLPKESRLSPTATERYPFSPPQCPPTMLSESSCLDNAIAQPTAPPSASVVSIVKEQSACVNDFDQSTWPVHAVQSVSTVASSSSESEPSSSMQVDTYSVGSVGKKARVSRGDSLHERSVFQPQPTHCCLASAFDGPAKRISTACQSAMAEKAKAATEYLRMQSGRSKEVNTHSQSWREFLGLSPTATAPVEHKLVAASPESGCSITAPLQRESTSLDSASARPMHMASANLPVKYVNRPVPKWALPARDDSRVNDRALSLDLQSGNVERNVEADVHEHLLRRAGKEREEFEIIQGSEGRIAVKVTRRQYDIMAWLPGFSVDNITISTKVTGSISIVANRWDNADHAAWDIKLGGNADMGSIRAKFEEGELHVMVSRHLNRAMHSSTPSVVSAPAVLGWPDAPSSSPRPSSGPPVASSPASSLHAGRTATGEACL